MAHNTINCLFPSARERDFVSKRNKRKPRPAKRKSRPATQATEKALEPEMNSVKSDSRMAATLAVIIFLCAFLLFQVQPMFCKAILPWFGGTPAVWTTSMFFFQVVLLAGYCYAHWTTSYLTEKWQMLLHVGLAGLAILLLPIAPSEVWKPTGQESDPTWRLLGLLSRDVGVQFFLLSTTAPLIQVWWHRRFGTAPYRLYAVSNAGSLLALLTYPFVIEPAFGLSQQIRAWSVAFFVVAAALAACSYQNARIPSSSRDKSFASGKSERPGWSHVLAWVALSTTGSVLLLAMTNHITQNVAVVPFLWIAPLALYLLSFVLVFGNKNYYRRGLYGGMMVISQVLAAFLYSFDATDNIVILLIVHLIALFAGCMVTHGELAKMKPDASYLTNYFVMISVGGAAGGFLVSIVAPYVFSSYYEYPLVLIACWVILFAVAFCDKSGYLYRGRPLWAWGLVAAACFVFLICIRHGVIAESFDSFLARRSFYGVLAVKPQLDDDGGKQIQLMNGTISHGSQYLDAERQAEPTAYYHRETGIGYAMELVAGKAKKRIGMLGLGVGTLAAYSEPGDYFRAYEINQDVIEIATNPDVFSFWDLLRQRGASGEIVVGDARLSLEKELAADNRGQQFDVLVLDVFSGDAIPVHLLTVQAFETYFKHLAPQGMLAVHISNRHLDLLPVVNSIASQFDVASAFVALPTSEWLILGPAEVIELLSKEHPEKIKLLAREPQLKVWTDDYSDILSVFK